MDAVAAKAREWDELADWYDILWPRTDDLSFYLALAAKHSGRILELGCGTGRVSCALAAAGHEVLGIDVSPGQLRRAEQRRAALPPAAAARVAFRQLDATAVDLAERFGLTIACFSTILELDGRPARVAAYRRCLEHLADDGVFAFDNVFYDTGQHAGWGKSRLEGVTYFLGAVSLPERPSVEYHHFESQAYEPDGRMTLTILLDELGPGGILCRRAFRVIRHYASPEQTEAELREAGFGEVELYGGFRGEDFLDPALSGRGRQVFVVHR